MGNEQITNIIQSHPMKIAEWAYPAIPLGNSELEFIVGSEDGEYTEKMDAMHLNFARIHFKGAIMTGIPIALAHAALTLAMNKNLIKSICDDDADYHYESDGHYEIGNTPARNREKFMRIFPSIKELRDFANEITRAPHPQQGQGD